MTAGTGLCPLTLQSIRLLSLEGRDLCSLFTAVSRLPMLSTLRVRETRWIEDPDSAQILLLRAAPALTALELPVIGWQNSCLPFLAQLSLRSLSLASPDFLDDGFRSFCATAMMSR